MVILGSLRSVRPNIAMYGMVVTGSSSIGTNFVVNFGVPASLFGSSTLGNRCFYGIVLLKMPISAGTTSFLFVLSPPGITQFDTVSIDDSKTKALCLAACPDGTFVAAQNYICEPCNNYIPYCHNCYNSSYCLACYSVAAIDVSHTSCLLCSHYMQHCREC